MAKLGFIGAGNMAAAIVGGIVKNGAFAAAEIAISDVDVNRCEEIRGEYGVNISAENICIARNSEIILLCVKPNILNEVIAEIRPHIKEEQLIISIAAGWTLAQLQGAFGGKARIVRVMPNTPALVNAAMTAICAAEDVSEADIRAVAEIFGAIGRTQILPERLFDAFIGVAGSSPAYAFIFIDALADAGVKYGLNRADALNFASQALLGAAEMVLSGGHPGALKDAVCSPGGTTIAAVAELEARGFRHAIIAAASACVEKSIKMSE